MTLQSNAQELFAADPRSPASQLMVDDNSALDMPEHYDHAGPEQLLSTGPIEVMEPGEVEIVVEELPGAPSGTPDPEPQLEVSEESVHAEEKEDANDAKKAKSPKDEKWDWASRGPTGFVAWIKEKVENVPKHSGFDTSGLERACAFLERVDNEISKAMRMDLDGELDANVIEKVRAEIDDGIARLQARLDKVKGSKKSFKKRKKAEYEIDVDGFIKEAQKITGVSGIVVTVPLLISSLARTCINGMVSAGHDVEQTYGQQVAKYKLNDRERLELRQLLFDMGMPMRIDMGMKPDEDIEVSDSDNYNWMANYRS